MKLRNKKTGEIGEVAGVMHFTVYEPNMPLVLGQYDTLAELNDEWEDVPKDPLIKDEKIRKAVRAWAEALYLKGAIFDFNDETMMLRSGKRGDNISFGGLDFCEFKHITAEYHTITELCGEE